MLPLSAKIPLFILRTWGLIWCTMAVGYACGGVFGQKPKIQMTISCFLDLFIRGGILIATVVFAGIIILFAVAGNRKR